MAMAKTTKPTTDTPTAASRPTVAPAAEDRAVVERSACWLRRRARTAPTDSGMTAAEAALFARLKARRLEIARERNAPAYTILTDAVLRQLAVETPRTEEAFAELNGVGPAKTRDWAETFLAIVNEEDGQGEVFDGGVDAESYGDDVDVNAYMDGFDDA